MRTTINNVLAVTALLAGTVRAACAGLPFEQLIRIVHCGSQAEISTCISVFAGSGPSAQTSDLRNCLESIGCSRELALAGSEWIASACEVSELDDLRRVDDLRRRADEKATAAAAATTAAAASTTSTADATSAAATTTATTSTSSSSSTPTANTCLDTSYSSVTWCFSTTTGGSVASSCVTTTTPTATCSAGLICATAAAGDVTCMKRDDSLTLSGFIVAIAFSVVVAIMIGSMIFMCCRSRRDARAMERARESSFLAARNDVESAQKASASEAHLPLMATQGPAGGEYTEFGAAVGRPETHRTPSGTYQDLVGAGRMRGDSPSIPPVPKLHPGLMSAPGDVGVYDGEDEHSRFIGRG